MMIFDQFPSLSEAQAFALVAQEKTHEPSIVCLDWEEFDRHEVFPYEVNFPCVLVPRSFDIKSEARIERLVEEFGGEFAGT